jgi:hypothetical protein
MATTDIQSVATTTQFDGTATEGLIEFDGAEIQGYQAVIYSIGFVPGAGTSAWTIDLVHPSGAASGNVNIQDGTAAELAIYDARIVVPKASATSSFNLSATTTGKTGNGVLTVVWGCEKLEG